MADRCIVCNRSVPGGEGEFCCPGCAAVYTIVGKMGLDGSERDERIAQLLEGVFPGGEEADAEQAEIENGQELCFLVGGMVCPACSWLVHNSLGKLNGVGNVNLNFIAETCTLTYDPMKIGKDDIHSNVERLGYKYYEGEDARRDGFDYFRFGAGWFFALNNMMISFVVYSAETWDVPFAMQLVCSILLAVFGTLVPLYAARTTMIYGFRQIMMRQYRMESLVVLSTTAAWIYSVYSMVTGDFHRLYFDVVTLLLMLIETGNLISGSFYKKLSRRVSSLSWQLPKKARVESIDVDEDYAAVEDLSPGQEFLVKRGEFVPTDGILMAPAEFDFSLITGESHGVSLEQGHYVGAGAKLLSEDARLSVPASGQSNLIKKIVESTIEAFNTRKEQLSFGDRISQYFVPIVVGVALVVLFGNLVIGDRGDAIIRMLSVLIVACPCAFGIAEPLVLTAAIEKVRGLGIQIFNGTVLALKPAVAVFDKTGTLTRGAPEVHKVVWLVEKNQKQLDILASLENGIEHPIARALALVGTPYPVADRTIARTVVSAKVDGKHWLAGSADLFPDVGIPPDLKESTIVMFGDAERCHCIVGLKDTVRDESKQLVADLKAQGVKSYIFSGDRKAVVEQVAGELGIADFHGEMGSTDKQREIAALQAQGKAVLMVGDGINDAQALAAADFGLAVFSGQIPAKMSADGVFMVPEIGKLCDLPFMQRKVRHKIRLNYGWAFLYNIVGMFLAGVGWLSPKYCAVGMVFSNLVVIWNSMHGMALPGRKA
ncbi:putative copper-importing P-type ATPase A [Pontiella desulfatans]|uniref:Putative copper-importing P-type ATPase A n=1 Tax=Pontiella desulfatans TaxID=2750659 RepID=A0A6C2TX39_PONDE|nr:heavy metal translocating P-type ATPase [Pontiella desulfatans]VGO12112.1 putative copper-importing P-type ATPase A [Pontiella desulfatans]